MNQQDQKPQAVKVNIAPLVLTAFVCTGLAVAGGYALSQIVEKRRDKKRIEEAKEEEDRQNMMPPMPMMFGGSASGSQRNLAEKLEETRNRQAEQDNRLKHLGDRLSAWEQSLAQRENHLRLVSGGGDDYEYEDDDD